MASASTLTSESLQLILMLFLLQRFSSRRIHLISPSFTCRMWLCKVKRLTVTQTTQVLMMPFNTPKETIGDLHMFTAHGIECIMAMYRGSAFVFQERVSWLTGVDEDDIAYCHHVADPPEDLRAAHTEVLLMQTVADLPQGSLHRLVLVDIEFHEHLPSTDTSTSRRCLSLPHLTQRRSLLRLLGLDIYCDKVKSRCLMWLNNILVPMQRKSSFHLEHGDYLRLAIPPWPSADSSISTRQCVSNIRRHRSAIEPLVDHQSRHKIHNMRLA